MVIFNLENLTPSRPLNFSQPPPLNYPPPPRNRSTPPVLPLLRGGFDYLLFQPS